MKKRIGLFIPPRPANHLAITDPSVAIGCLQPGMHAELMQHLQKQPDIEWVDNLNFSNGLIRNGELWCGDVFLNELDGLVWYSEVDRRPGSFDLTALKTLSRKIRVVRDPFLFESALDKYTAHLALLDAGANVAESVLFDHRVPRKMADIMDEWGAAILKPRRGGWGKGVTYIDNPGVLRDVIGYVQSTAGHSPDQGYFLERYYPNDLNKWASITMIDGEVMYGYRKLDAKQVDMGGGRIKILDADEKGGGVEMAQLNDEQIRQAEIAYSALPLGLIGFDMIWVKDKPIIVDENTSPGNYQQLYEQVDIAPGERLAKWMLKAIVAE
jgi:glutathione synthase/RimK-type ligase-like ATP-grasp enzyme